MDALDKEEEDEEGDEDGGDSRDGESLVGAGGFAATGTRFTGLGAIAGLGPTGGRGFEDGGSPPWRLKQRSRYFSIYTISRIYLLQM